MRITEFLKREMRLILALLLLLAYQKPFTFDMSDHQYNSLKPITQKVLKSLKSPLHIQLISPNPDIQLRVQQVVALFTKQNPLIDFHASRNPLPFEEKQRLSLTTNHHLILRLDDQIQAVDLDMNHFGQKNLSTTIAQLLRHHQQWTLFVRGHGEIDPFGEKGPDFGQLTKTLKDQGIRLGTLDLATAGIIPDNTQLLVLADPKSPLLPKEMAQLKSYIQKGGNLLWLSGPHPAAGFETLSTLLGASYSGGLIIDPKSHQLGTPHQTISLVHQYPTHPLSHLKQLTVFPNATPIESSLAKTRGWIAKPFLITNDSTHLQGPKKGRNQGPFTIGLSLTKGAQRIVLIGSTACFSNAALHNYSNPELASNLFNWLNKGDELMPTDQPSLPGPVLKLPWQAEQFVRYGFPYGLPLIFLFIGWINHHYRHKGLS